MLWLPSIPARSLWLRPESAPAGDEGLKLPLTGSDAVWLVEHLLAPEGEGAGEDRVEKLAAWLRESPAAAAWAFLKTQPLGESPPVGDDDSAGGASFATLAEVFLRDLHDPQPAEDATRQAVSWLRWESRTRAAVLALRRAEDSPQDSRRLDTLRLAVYVAAAVERFIELHAEPHEVAGQLAVGLGAWFGPRVADEIAEARERFRDCGRDDSPELSSDDAQIWSEARQGAERHWRDPAAPASSGPFAERILPRLLRRSARLEQLEQQFDASLETAMMTALKELAYGASHEINNPLMNISTRAQTLLMDESEPERRQALAKIASQAFRAHEMISDLMLFAKPPTLECREVNVLAVVAEVLAELGEEASEQGTTLQCDPAWDSAADDSSRPASAAYWWTLDPDYLAEALKATIRNSLESLKAGGRVQVRVTVSREPSAQLEIAVSDSGPGVPEELRSRLFVPYFSGREAGRGLGVGLAKSWRIMDCHGGTIRVDRPELGARLVLSFPRRPRPATESPGARTSVEDVSAD